MKLNRSMLVAALLTTNGLSYASPACDELAQMAVDIREDYRNLNELKSGLLVERAKLEGLAGTTSYLVGAAAINKKEIVGGALFTKTFAGLKGNMLHAKFLQLCMDGEREDEARAARQAARAAKRNASKGHVEDNP